VGHKISSQFIQHFNGASFGYQFCSLLCLMSVQVMDNI